PVEMIAVKRFVRLPEPPPVHTDAPETPAGKPIELVFKLPVAERPAVQKQQGPGTFGIDILHIPANPLLHPDKESHGDTSALRMCCRLQDTRPGGQGCLVSGEASGTVCRLPSQGCPPCPATRSVIRTDKMPWGRNPPNSNRFDFHPPHIMPILSAFDIESDKQPVAGRRPFHAADTGVIRRDEGRFPAVIAARRSGSVSPFGPSG